MRLNTRLASALVGATICCAPFALAGCFGSASPSPQAGGPTAARADADCAVLSGFRRDAVEIEDARVQTAGAPVDGAHRPGMTGENTGVQVAGLPAFCRVVGAIHPEPGSNIRFEVWLPMLDWNGRLFGANNGGLAGSIRYDDLAAAILNGGAGAATDTGHSSSERAWAVGRPERVRDYGWRAIHETTVLAKDMADAFYGRRPDHSYFVGCSNGGRMALIEASRFPEDYDGIVAGAPAVAFTALVSTMINTARVQQAPGAAIRSEQAQLLQSEVLRQCDDIDGQHDGLVADPRQCRFNYAALACGATSSPQCFTPPQIEALRALHSGPHDSAGRRIGFGYPPSGSEVSLSNAGWDMMLLSPRVSGGGFANPIIHDMPPAPIATDQSFDFDVHPDQVRRQLAGDLDAPPDLRRFFARGGKLIVWHGWADPTLPPEATLAYYDDMARTSGVRAREQARLFMIPGMQHCSGGLGADSFGQIGAAPVSASPDRNVAAAVVDWVEQGRAPDALIGVHGGLAPPGMPAQSGAVMERLHCAYPAQSVLRAGADPNSAASYSCRAP